jgi:hypothetical protein
MIAWFLNLFSNQQEDYEERLLAFAKREYPKDWFYAFNRLLENKRPYFD